MNKTFVLLGWLHVNEAALLPSAAKRSYDWNVSLSVSLSLALSLPDGKCRPSTLSRPLALGNGTFFVIVAAAPSSLPPQPHDADL